MCRLKPCQASDLLIQAREQVVDEAGEEDASAVPEAEPPPRLATGEKAVDAMLDGGLDFGQITYLTAEDSCQGLLAMNALIASHLLSSFDSKIIILDVMSTYDIQGIYETISTRLPGPNSISKDEQVMGIMDRVTISKLFEMKYLQQTLDTYIKKMDAQCEASLTQGMDERFLVMACGLSNVIQGRHDSVQTQAASQCLLRSMSNLARTYGMCVVIFETGTLRDINTLASWFFVSNDTHSRRLQDLSSYTALHLHISTKWIDSAVSRQSTLGPKPDSMRRPRAKMTEIIRDVYYGRQGLWTYVRIADTADN